MAKIADLNTAEWGRWLAERPQVIRDMAVKYPPDRLYRMSSSGHRCYLLSYNEDDTVTVAVTGQYNFVVFDRRVYGVDASELVECELPGEDELVGTMLSAGSGEN